MGDANRLAAGKARAYLQHFSKKCTLKINTFNLGITCQKLVVEQKVGNCDPQTH